MSLQQPPHNFSWFVDKKLAGLAHPGEEDMAFLAQQGIKTLINLCERSPYYLAKAEAAGIKMVSIPIIDFTPPTHQQIKEFLDIVKFSVDVSAGKATVHITYDI